MRTKSTVVVSVLVAVALLLTLFVGRAAAQGVPQESGVQITSATPIDTNGNGLYDLIRVSFVMNVTVGGNFHVLVQVRAGLYNVSVVNAYKEANLSAGSHTLSVDIRGPAIYTSGMDGPYYIHLEPYAVDNDGMFWDQGIYPGGTADTVIPSLLHTSFDPPWARLGTPITDNGLDTDGDGLYNYLVVHIPIVVVARGNVSVSGYLQAGSFFGYIASIPTEDRTLESGTQTWDMRFDGRALRYIGQSGSYAVSITLQLPGLPGSNQTTYRTRSYSATAFQSPPAMFTQRTYTGTLLDTNGDGRADFYDFPIAMDIREAGDYLVELILLQSTYPTYTQAPAVRLLHLSPGNQTVDLRISGITMSRMNPIAILQAELLAIRVDGLPVGLLGGLFPADIATWQMAFPSGTFDSRPYANLTLTMAFPSYICPSIVAIDPSTKFLMSGGTSCGYGQPITATVPLYAGTFDVLVTAGYRPPYATSFGVTMSGPTSLDVSFAQPAPEQVQATITAVNWNDTVATTRVTLSSQATGFRFLSDFAGNLDGSADTTEMRLAAEYLQLGLGFYSPYGALGPSLLDIRMGETPLPPISSTVDSVAGAGSILSTDPVVVGSSFEYRSTNDLGPAPNTLSVRVPYTDMNLSYALVVDASAFDVGRTAAISHLDGLAEGFTWDANAAIQPSGTNVWTIAVGAKPAYLGVTPEFEFQVVLTGGPHPSVISLVILTSLIAVPAIIMGVAAFLWWRARKRRGEAPKK